MGREIRMVPPNWEHPKDDNGNDLPMFDEEYSVARKEWLDGLAAAHSPASPSAACSPGSTVTRGSPSRSAPLATGCHAQHVRRLARRMTRNIRLFTLAGRCVSTSGRRARWLRRRGARHEHRLPSLP